MDAGVKPTGRYSRHPLTGASQTYYARSTDYTQHNVAYHFQNDADTLPFVLEAVREVYDGPVDFAQDFMVWNVTKDGVRTRMAVANQESYPTPPLHKKEVASGDDRYRTPDRVLAGWPEEFNDVANKIYTDFNKEHGTNFKFKLKK